MRNLYKYICSSVRCLAWSGGGSSVTGGGLCGGVLGVCQAAVFRTVQAVRLGGRTRRTAGGSPFSSEPVGGLGQMEVGPDPVGPCGVFLLHLFGW